MSEWKEYKFSDLMEIIGGGTPKTTVPEYWGGEIPWLSVVDFNNGKKYCFDAEKKITESGLKESSTKILKKGQIIISARGTVGVISMLGRDMAFNQSNYGIDANQQLTDNEYLYYLLKFNIPNFISNSYGAVFDTITKETFDQISVLIPEIPEQRAIASILSSLDDKIDLRHRQNKTLEALAETLFRQRFVEEADESWEEDSLGNYLSVVDNRGKTPPISQEITGYPLIEANALNGESRFVNYSVIKKYVNFETSKTWFRDQLRKYDTLMTTVGANIGALVMYIIVRGNIAQNIIGLSAQNISPFYLYQTLKYKINEILQLDIGGVQPSIKVPHLLSIPILIPPNEIEQQFVNSITPMIKKMENNYLEISTLEKLRDTLLPKLMSGEIRLNCDSFD